MPPPNLQNSPPPSISRRAERECRVPRTLTQPVVGKMASIAAGFFLRKTVGNVGNILTKSLPLVRRPFLLAISFRVKEKIKMGKVFNRVPCYIS